MSRHRGCSLSRAFRPAVGTPRSFIQCRHRPHQARPPRLCIGVLTYTAEVLTDRRRVCVNILHNSKDLLDCWAGQGQWQETGKQNVPSMMRAFFGSFKDEDTGPLPLGSCNNPAVGIWMLICSSRQWHVLKQLSETRKHPSVLVEFWSLLLQSVLLERSSYKCLGSRPSGHPAILGHACFTKRPFEIWKPKPLARRRAPANHGPNLSLSLSIYIYISLSLFFSLSLSAWGACRTHGWETERERESERERERLIKDWRGIARFGPSSCHQVLVCCSTSKPSFLKMFTVSFLVHVGIAL